MSGRSSGGFCPPVGMLRNGRVHVTERSCGTACRPRALRELWAASCEMAGAIGTAAGRRMGAHDARAGLLHGCTAAEAERALRTGAHGRAATQSTIGHGSMLNPVGNRPSAVVPSAKKMGKPAGLRLARRALVSSIINLKPTIQSISSKHIARNAHGYPG